MGFLIACFIWIAVLALITAGLLKLVDRLYPKKMAYPNTAQGRRALFFRRLVD